MDDALLVRGVHHLADSVKERNEARERQRPLRLEELVQRRAPHQLHGDPEQTVRLGAKGIDVRGVRVVQSRGEACLAHESLNRVLADLGAGLEDLHHGLASQSPLLCSEDRPEAALPELLSYYELAEGAPQQLARWHR